MREGDHLEHLQVDRTKSTVGGGGRHGQKSSLQGLRGKVERETMLVSSVQRKRYSSNFQSQKPELM